jgi:hypothetical protein
MAFYQVPRNLPHAATIVRRIEYRLRSSGVEETPENEQLWMHVEQLHSLIGKYEGGEDPADIVADQVAEEAAGAGRDLVTEIEKQSLGEDRLGQAIRNLFECLGFPEEGASISLRAGEDPNSLMRPR